MNKFLNYISITLMAVALFSCNKNEWTPEKETEFKKAFKDSLQSAGKGIFSEDQIVYVSDCVLEKMKSKNLKPNDAQTPETSIMVMHMGKECAQESFVKCKTLSKSEVKNSWDSNTEEKYKAILKDGFVRTGLSNEKASFIADCAISKLKEQNIGPADLQDPKNGVLVQKIGKNCAEELMKKK
ncbi:hypothetical protein IRZ83_07730 [Flavobacterium sp. JLP]|uniref:hypothetical protein n=1 Tax=Flavobacterium sp. JLP TaxID=2783793 RepID=UPI00188AF3D9|nr:hypothetical protein [Flavobacterium sp. JLP]MBF4506557.1 hypothetical protein [Flavobacterium sp. JLP]